MKFSLLTLLLVSVFVKANAEGTPDTWIIESIQCVGNVRTECQYLSREIHLSPGDNLNESEVENGRLRLLATGLFEKVEVRLDKGSEKGKVNLKIDLQEQDPLFTEVRSGTSLLDNKWKQRLGAKIGNRNLFGTGKILELEAETLQSLSNTDDKYSDRNNRHYLGRLQYTDPHLFDSKNYFLTTGATYFSEDYQYYDYYSGAPVNENYNELALDMTVGRRLHDFDYLAFAYRIRPSIRSGSGTAYSDLGHYSLIYGFNTEDDTYFPTHGKKSYFSVGYHPEHSRSYTYWTVNLFYRQTWQVDSGKFLTFQFGSSDRPNNIPVFSDNLSLSLAYSQDINAWRESGKNARWYIEPGLYRFGNTYSVGSEFVASESNYQSRLWIQPGAKAGIRVESKTFGLIDIYGLAATGPRFF